MKRRQFLAGIGAVAVGVGASRPSFGVAEQPLVRLGAIGISFHAVVGSVVQSVLTRLGARVEPSTAPHDVMFDRLGSGEVDLLATAWMPGTHSHLFAPIQDRIESISTIYSDAKLYWSVPEYVPADAVSSIFDLRKPEIMARMDKTIRSIGPTAGLSVRSQRAAAEYELDAVGYRVVSGDAGDWLQSFREAYAAERWMVMPLWQPQFLNRTHDLRILQDPKGVMGDADSAVLVADRAFLARFPVPMARALQAIEIGLDGVTEMDLAVNVRGLTPSEAAAEWMDENRARVSDWLA